jgi:hypothetical protein
MQAEAALRRQRSVRRRRQVDAVDRPRAGAAGAGESVIQIDADLATIPSRKMSRFWTIYLDWPFAVDTRFSSVERWGFRECLEEPGSKRTLGPKSPMHRCGCLFGSSDAVLPRSASAVRRRLIGQFHTVGGLHRRGEESRTNLEAINQLAIERGGPSHFRGDPHAEQRTRDSGYGDRRPYDHLRGHAERARMDEDDDAIAGAAERCERSSGIDHQYTRLEDPDDTCARHPDAVSRELGNC